MDLPLESVFDDLEDGILVADDALHPLWLNRACGRLLGVEPSMAGSEPEQTSALGGFLRRLGLDPVQGLEPGRKHVQRLQVGPAGGSRPVEVVVTLGQIAAGRRIVVASIRDISAQQQMEQAVYDARKTQAIAALANGIAHDFNNILTAVISQIDLVLYGGEIPPALRQHLIYAQTSARRGAELVGRLQAFSRQSAPKFEVIDLVDAVDQAIFMLRRSVSPLIEICPPAGAAGGFLVKADTNQLLQVILNIGINARDAMPKGGTITFFLESRTFSTSAAIAPRRAGEFVCLRLQDTGHGMSPEVLARIFEPYFSTKDLSHAPGLALSIAASVVAEHGGWIEVTSAEGTGTCFSIYLPKTATPEAPRPVPPVEARAADGHERILVVDDEELVRMVTMAVLAYRGYQMFGAKDGEEAIQKYRESDPGFDLVLMDLHMPRLNGYDALLRIRELDPRLKAILLSGGSQDPDSLGGEIEGVAYLQKPFDNQHLANLVRTLLDAR